MKKKLSMPTNHNDVVLARIHPTTQVALKSEQTEEGMFIAMSEETLNDFAGANPETYLREIETIQDTLRRPDFVGVGTYISFVRQYYSYERGMLVNRVVNVKPQDKGLYIVDWQDLSNTAEISESEDGPIEFTRVV